ncbi:MAG: hypothetical protein KTR25_05365 [Myxococcales bacterium]|nr:hypothetical protein [Myxococcales bacterium]
MSPNHRPERHEVIQTSFSTHSLVTGLRILFLALITLSLSTVMLTAIVLWSTQEPDISNEATQNLSTAR